MAHWPYHIFDLSYLSMRSSRLWVHISNTCASFISPFSWTLYTPHCIQEDWEALLSSIRDGTILDIEHIDHVRAYLQAIWKPTIVSEESTLTCV